MAFITAGCSSIGRNAYGVLLYDIGFITTDFVRSYVQLAQSLDVILTVYCLLKLLHVRHGYSSLRLFLRLMSLCMLFGILSAS